MVGMVIVGNAIHKGVYPPSKAPDQALYYWGGAPHLPSVPFTFRTSLCFPYAGLSVPGFDPATFRAEGECSTNWAMQAQAKSQ